LSGDFERSIFVECLQLLPDV